LEERRFLFNGALEVIKDGEDWKDTEQLASGDLMNAVRVLQRAEDYISRQ
jgi:hypothetical protein